MTTTPTLLSTEEVSARTGISFRMLDHWRRHGAIHPSQPSTGSGSYAGYSQKDAAIIEAIGRVRRDLLSLHVTPTHQLVAELWHHLTTWNTAELHTGTVNITVHLDKGEQ
jgi:hypothetical protein